MLHLSVRAHRLAVWAVSLAAIIAFATLTATSAHNGSPRA